MALHDTNFEQGVATKVVPVFLDNHPEMQIGTMLMNMEFFDEFNAGVPLATYYMTCPEHGKEVSHYSLRSVPRQQAKVEATV